MELDQIITAIQHHTETLCQQGVQCLVLIGPVARREVSKSGDIDFILQMHPPATFEHFRQIKETLQSLIGYPVELTVEDPRHPAIWPYIEEDAIFLIDACS